MSFEEHGGLSSHLYSHGHKNTITSVKWNKNGNWLLTGSRDQFVKIFDIRAMKELATYKSHRKEVNCKFY